MSVRVRFAPSPTGYLHVGGLRTALYNYLFARNHQGVLVLRIEDTDQTRYVEGAAESLIQTLRLTGIEYDEGPDVGGDYGPYVQSQRREIYKEHGQQLIENSHAYHCFCTPEDLEKMREEQVAHGLNPQYDRKCRNLEAGEISQKLEQGIPHVIRLKMPLEGDTVIEDIIRGTVSFQNELQDDQILIKSDGYPTYHLANVVDDHLMGITHVIRGEEWLLSLPKHAQLYKAFGWESPKFAHLPLLLNPDRSKLSKRQGDVAVEDYLEKGYLPQALINFLALLGWNLGTDQEFFSMEELIKQFSLERVSKPGAVFDVEKLKWMNGHYIRELPENERNEFITSLFKKAGFEVSDSEKTKKIISGIYKKISTGEDVKREVQIFYLDEIQITENDALEFLKKESSKSVLEKFLMNLETVDRLDMESFQQIMKNVRDETGITKQDLWMPIRIALTGVTHGADLPLVIEIFGKKKVENFVKQVLRKYF
jgi:nondiscriminating glutamyl-tRNA synthetase